MQDNVPTAQSRDVACPVCGAGQGERCRGSAYSGRSDRPVDYHTARRELARGIKPTGPSRTPRPAHPAQLAADRIMVVLREHQSYITEYEYQAFHTVRRALWRIAEEDES